MDVSRRDFVGSALLAGGWLAFAADAHVQDAQPTTSAPATPGAGASATGASATGTPATGIPAGGPYTLAPLPYGYADLEPHLDAETMKLHHDVHHLAYVTGANAALNEIERIRRTGGDEYKASLRNATDSLAFNLSGHVLHNVFWNNMRPDAGGDPPGESLIAQALKREFGTLDKFREQFAWTASTVQGAGWGILGYDPTASRLLCVQAEKHQNSACWGLVPLLVVDVWEHAYYLRYKNQRASYLKAFMNVIHWADVDARYRAAGAAGTARA